MRKCAIALAALCIVAAAVPASAQEALYLEYSAPARPYDPTWPPDGAQWHELNPTYCATHGQTGHEDDNGNGAIDVCENMTLDGVRYHIDWIGPTYKLVYGPNGRPPTFKYAEGPIPGRQNLYHEVAPVFCREFETQTPIEFVCQEVYITFPPEDVGWWHVEEINTNVIVTPNPLNPVKQSTWSKIKAFFKSLLDF